MNHLTFIETIKGKRKADRYGWVTCDIGRYRFRTNGAAWTCITIGTNRTVTRLPIVIAEWKRQQAQMT